MPQITVLAGYGRPEQPTIDKIADLLKVEPTTLKVDRAKKMLGYVVVDVPHIDKDVRKQIQAMAAVTQVA